MKFSLGTNVRLFIQYISALYTTERGMVSSRDPFHFWGTNDISGMAQATVVIKC